MNNRQKAKHWKQLYEMSLPKKPYPVVYQKTSLQHLRYVQSIRKLELIQGGSLLEGNIRNLLVKKTCEELKGRIIAIENIEMDSIEYSLDIWVPEQGDIE
jgi:hypothetical protein